jgi:hypothetical protein
MHNKTELRSKEGYLRIINLLRVIIAAGFAPKSFLLLGVKHFQIGFV